MKVLVTGGAGFIGRHLVDRLLQHGHQVRVLDFLRGVAHPDRDAGDKIASGMIDQGVEFVPESILSVTQGILRDVEVVIHLAADVGVGDSMYMFNSYVNTNTLGTANLLSHLLRKDPPIKKLIVASSMSVYGGSNHPDRRMCETDPPYPQSVYGMTKRHQEELCLLFGKTYNVPTIALRLFNVYGPGQAFGNPYTGVMPIFINRIMHDQPPIIYGDGTQTRDFIHVDDVVTYFVEALEKDIPSGPYNVGTGTPTRILDLANMIIHHIVYSGMLPEVTYQQRKGDVLHCSANMHLTNQEFGIRPKVWLVDGLIKVIDWYASQPLPELSDVAYDQLRKYQLLEPSRTLFSEGRLE